MIPMARIPKIIHLCWLSGDPYPETIARCIDSWRKTMPDYEIWLWDRARFDAEVDNRFACEALKLRKWAFVADYIRFYALYTYGGIYMDSDVRVYRSFDDLLDDRFFSGIEYFKPTDYIAIEAAVMGSEAGHPLMETCLALYASIPFVLPDGSIDQTTVTKRMAAEAARGWGFEYRDQEQRLRDGVHIYPSVVFTNPSGEFSTTKTYALHLCNGSWIDRKPSLGTRAVRFVARYYNKPHKAVENLYKKIKTKLLG